MMNNARRRLLPLPLIVALLGGCAQTPNAPAAKGVVGKVGKTGGKIASSVVGGPLIPDASLQLSPSVAMPLEKIVFWGAWAGAAWLILDPLAPNWEIEEVRLPQNHLHLHMIMKRFYVGGAGEARQIFHRRAKQLMLASGYSGYEVVEYSEGIESSILGSRRSADGVIRFTREQG